MDVLAPTTATVSSSEEQDFSFPAISGYRYEVLVRTSPGSGDNAWTLLSILPPRATDSSQAVLVQTIPACDRGAGFTASVTGTYTVRLKVISGSGDFTVSTEAVGTAVHRSPLLAADDVSHSFHSHCYLDTCSYDIGSDVVYESDGKGFEMRFEAVAGVAYAFEARGSDALAMSLTIYEQGADEGSAAFGSLLDGGIGQWSTTRPGHQSFAESQGCENGDLICAAQTYPAYAQFPMLGGQSFPLRQLRTWVAPASGTWLLHVGLTCDVPAFSDIGTIGCETQPPPYLPICNDGSSRSCASGFGITVTSGAYWDAEGSIQTGGSSSTATHPFTRLEIEARVSAYFDRVPRDQRTMESAPSLPEMMISGSPAADLLSRAFTNEQLPHVVYPTSILPLTSDDLDRELNGQDPSGIWREGDEVAGVHVAIAAKAPSHSESERATYSESSQ